MLKSSKLSHKQHKSSKDSSSRKNHISKKSVRSRSPNRISGTSRTSAGIKHISPGLQGADSLQKRKTSHSPRLRSIASSPHRSLVHRKQQESAVTMERVHSMKRYEKTKHLSNSPGRHLSPNSSRRGMVPMHAHAMNPYPAARYPSSSAVSPPYASPSRKKPRREPDRYFTNESMNDSPPHRHPAPPMRPESHMSRRDAPPPVHEKHHRNTQPVSREKHAYDGRSRHLSPSGIPSNHSKASPMKPQYVGEGSSRYPSSSVSKGYSSGGQKSFGPTLHERFSTVVESNRSEPHIKYTREDLEKITIDIRRNMRESSPTLRHIVNPSDVKLVRRANEGHRPIFDRDEIKQAPRDMREDAYYERKKMSGSYTSNHGIDLREVENYQITRHRFDSHHDLFSSGSGRTLNDRFQNPGGRKDPSSIDRDLREKPYERIPTIGGYAVARSRSRSGDRDFRSERYIDSKPTQNRPQYPRRPAPEDIPQTRNNVPYPHRKSNVPVDVRHKLGVRKSDGRPSSVRSESKSSFHPHSERQYPVSMPSSRIERREPPISEPPKWAYKGRSPSHEKPDFARRPEKLGYSKPWSDRPSLPPKGPNYYEHERREGSSSYSARGGSRPFRSPRGSYRARGFRGSTRGTSFRGSFRGYGSSSASRGRGMMRR